MDSFSSLQWQQLEMMTGVFFKSYALGTFRIKNNTEQHILKFYAINDT